MKHSKRLVFVLGFVCVFCVSVCVCSSVEWLWVLAASFN